MFIFSLVYLFIIKLRFPRKYTLTQIIRKRYGDETLKLFRNCEKSEKKTRKVNCDIDFLKKCRNQGLIPKFLKFKLYNFQLTRNRDYINFQEKLLKKEITSQEKKYKSILATNSRLHNLLKEKVSWIDYNHFTQRIASTVEKHIINVNLIHNKKLQKLGYVTDKLSNEKIIFNLSSRRLTTEELDILSKGLKFSFAIRKPKYIPHFLEFENLYSRLDKFDIHKNYNTDYVKSGIKNIAHSSFFGNFHHNNLFNNEELQTLKNLASDESLVICKPDKGYGVVILDKEDYLNKMEDILSDKTKFTLINDDLAKITLRYEDKVNNFLRALKKKGKINEDLYNSLHVSGSMPGVMYGLPKVHKTDCPTRPILSAVNTYNYKLAKFLVPILAPFTTNEYTVHDSFSFAKEISTTPNSSQYFMASFDIKSLFTNIPIDETINIITDQLFDHNNSSLLVELNKKELKQMLTLASKEGLFLFNNKNYTQHDGVAMGSPLGPSMALGFLCYHEKQWLKNCPSEFKPIMYKRYVDDTFILFKKEEDVEIFLDYMNTRHDNIKFTSDKEINCSLPFLDVTISRENNVFSTKVFRKNTFTGLTTKYYSLVPFSYKLNLIKTLFNRAYNICSSYMSLAIELNLIKTLLSNNGFPVKLIESTYGKLFNKIYNKKIVETVNKAIVYITIDYTGNRSIYIKRQLQKLSQTCYPQIKLRVSFRIPNQLSNFFNHKDKLPKELLSGVVYKYKCGGCDASYVGKTQRSLNHRIMEHYGKSFRTGRRLISPPHSAIRTHALEEDHPIWEGNFDILFNPRYGRDLYTCEALAQRHKKPSLGNTEGINKLIT